MREMVVVLVAVLDAAGADFCSLMISSCFSSYAFLFTGK
jgi:hypothetical protein